MLNFKSIKFLPSEYVFKYKKGKIVKEGKGLSFIYYVPNTSVVVIPTSSADVPFIFQEITNDYQTVSVQGQITYKIADYKRVSEILDYTYDMKKKKYVTEDYKKIPQRLVNITKVLTKKSIENMPLKEAIKSSESLANLIRETLIDSKEVLNLGIEIIGFSILAISPNKETARALEATAREEILKKADEAIYERRNSSIEQERIVKENELNTEIAIEEKRKEFIKLSVENAKEESDSKAYQFAAMMKVFNEMDPNVIQALATINMEPEKLIAGAFQQLANKADKIGELNISPDLLQSLMKGRN